MILLKWRKCLFFRFIFTSTRRRKKEAKFKDRHKYSKPVRAAELNIGRNKNLESSKSKHFALQVGNKAINANGTNEEESHSSHESQQKYSLVMNNRKQREKQKTYAEALKEDLRNGVKETREVVVSDKERNTGIRDNVAYVNKVMDFSEEDSSEFGKPKANFLEIYKDLLFSEQIDSSGMFSTSPVLNTDTSTSHNASNTSIRTTCAYADLSLDTHDEDLQCSANQRIVEECTESVH